MRGNRIYLILLGALLVLSLYFFLNRRYGSNASSGQTFAVPDTGRVESILISDAGEPMQLFRNGGSWLVNGFPARNETVQGMLMLISRIEVEAPVSRVQEERIIRALNQEGMFVQIGIKDKGFKEYALIYDSISASTCMMMRNSENPFRVRVRGYRNRNLAEFFSADQKYWRDHVIFRYPPQDISRVLLQNNRFPAKSFQLQRISGGDFMIAPGILPKDWSAPRKDRVEQYLAYFYDVGFESFLEAGRDTLYHAEEPDYVLSVDLLNGKRTLVRFFPAYHTGKDGPGEPDIHSLYAEIDPGGDWIVVKYVEIDLLLKEYDYFAGP